MMTIRRDRDLNPDSFRNPLSLFRKNSNPAKARLGPVAKGDLGVDQKTTLTFLFEADGRTGSPTPGMRSYRVGTCFKCFCVQSSFLSAVHV